MKGPHILVVSFDTNEIINHEIIHKKYQLEAFYVAFTRESSKE